MKKVNGKIVEATESEMFSIYLQNEWDEVMDFNRFMDICEEDGTKVIREGANNAEG